MKSGFIRVVRVFFPAISGPTSLRSPPFLLMVKGIVDKDVTSQQYPGDPCDEYRDALMVIYTLIECVIAEFITMPDIPVFPGDIMVGDLPKGPF